tara:strand:- start:153 stop:437 length:285 start_codon:yes stop_codon:yes gene_type:complete
MVYGFLLAESDYLVFYFNAVAIADQAESMVLIEFILSKIPSHPRTIKSFVFSSILNYDISGSELTTPGLPPNFSNLASMSPNVLDTLNRPGRTL